MMSTSLHILSLIYLEGIRCLRIIRQINVEEQPFVSKPGMGTSKTILITGISLVLLCALQYNGLYSLA